MSIVIQRKDLIASFGATVRELRTKSGMTQLDLANRIDVVFATINRIENGHHCPDATQLFNLAEALGVSVDEFRPKQKKTKQTA